MGEIDQLIDERLAQLLAMAHPDRTDPTCFFGHQFDAGLANVAWPVGVGGLAAEPGLQRRVDECLRAAGAKSALLRNPLGVGMGLPTVLQWGTAEQQDRWGRPCFTTEEMWCQLFSEPGAGSDLASLATRAVRDGNEWVITGQKVWTSLAHVARRGMLLARTDPSLPKHAGLTFFVVDMSAPGVTVRPLRQMTGEAEFNEVFLDGVRIPDTDRVGGVGAGWRVGTTTLMNERVVLSGAGSGAANVGGSKVTTIIALANSTGAWGDPILRQRLIERWIEGRLIQLMNQRSRAARKVGRPGPEGSLTKLAQGLHNRRLQEAAVHVLGARGQAWAGADTEADATARGFLRAQGNTIEGGTSDVLRNVIAERVLGLPKEPGPARETPWDKLLRS